ncbi:hypothetical protein LQW54_000086 [Pestalotiopsis sp. IQ-011]
MQFTALLLLLGATAAIATPLQGRGGGDGEGGGDGGGEGGGSGGGDGGGDGGSTYVACTPGALYTNAQCCATDVLGVADLDCANPSAIPASAYAFQADCATVGKTARCCVIPVAGQDVLCTTPQGL